MLRGVLFDVDGTLVDSTYVHVLALSRAFAEVGVVEQPPMALLHGFIGMAGAQLIETIVGQPDPRVADAHRRHLEDLTPDIRAFPGASELLRTLASRDLTIVLATSGRADEVEARMGLLDADDAIAHVVSSDDVAAGKPAPDIFAFALEQAGLTAAEAIVVGDATWDMAAAGRCGIPAIGLRSGGIRAAALTGAGAMAVYDSPAHLLAELDGSPLVGAPPSRDGAGGGAAVP